MRSTLSRARITGRTLTVTTALLAALLTTTAAPSASAAPTAVAAATSPAALFVTAAFHDFTDRPPSTASRSLWTARIATGAWTRKAFITYLATSPAALNATVRTGLPLDPRSTAHPRRAGQLGEAARLAPPHPGGPREEALRLRRVLPAHRWLVGLLVGDQPLHPHAPRHHPHVGAARPLDRRGGGEGTRPGGRRVLRHGRRGHRPDQGAVPPAAAPGPHGQHAPTWLALAKSRGDVAVAGGPRLERRVPVPVGDPLRPPSSPRASTFAETVFIGQPDPPLGLTTQGGTGPLVVHTFGVPDRHAGRRRRQQPVRRHALSLHGTPDRTGTSTVTIWVLDAYGSLAVATGVVTADHQLQPGAARHRLRLRPSGRRRRRSPSTRSPPASTESVADRRCRAGGRRTRPPSRAPSRPSCPTGITYVPDGATGRLYGQSPPSRACSRSPSRPPTPTAPTSPPPSTCWCCDDVASAPLTGVTSARRRAARPRAATCTAGATPPGRRAGSPRRRSPRGCRACRA